MKIHDVKQGSEEWLALRRTYFTGSALGEWLIDGDRTKTSRKAWQNAIWNKLGELSQDDEPSFPNWAMKRGTELEPLARAAYEKHTGFKVREVGFISHECDGFGVSPDGLICGDSDFPIGDGDFYHGLELKCPVARTMLKWLDAGTLPDEHKLQVHASLAASGLQRWDFFAWHPELVPLHIIVQRDEFTEQVLAGLLKLSDDYSAAKAKLAKWIATPTAETP
jgi:predicted phage-related endonuclease